MIVVFILNYLKVPESKERLTGMIRLARGVKAAWDESEERLAPQSIYLNIFVENSAILDDIEVTMAKDWNAELFGLDFGVKASCHG